MEGGGGVFKMVVNTIELYNTKGAWFSWTYTYTGILIPLLFWLYNITLHSDPCMLKPPFVQVVSQLRYLCC